MKVPSSKQTSASSSHLLEQALSEIGALEISEDVVSATFLAGPSSTEADLLPCPGSAELRKLVSALLCKEVDKHRIAALVPLRHLDAVLLAAATRGSSEVACLAGVAYIVLIRVAPDAHDHFLFETLIHKVLNIANLGANGKKSRARKPKSHRTRASQTTAPDEDGFSADEEERKAETTPGITAGGDGPSPEDMNEFWTQFVCTIEKTALCSRNSDFASVAALGLSGLLRTSSTAMSLSLAETGFQALLVQGRQSSSIADLLRAVYGALLPLLTSGKLSTACRSRLCAILHSAVELESSDGVDETGTPALPSSPRTPTKTPSKHATRIDPATIELSSALSAEGTERNGGVNANGGNSKTRSSLNNPLSPRKQITVAFIQTVCMRPPERMEDRTLAGSLIMEVMKDLEISDLEHCVNFLSKLAQQPRSLHRLFAVELSLQSLQLAIASSNSVRVIMTTLHDRAADKIPAVRAKAISCLALAIETIAKEDHLSSTAKWTLSAILAPAFDLESRADDAKSGVRKSVVQLILVTAQCLLKGSDDDGNLSASEHSDSEGSPVRKRPRLSEFSRSSDDVARNLARAIRGRCEDLIPTVRRTAMQALTALVEQLYAEDKKSVVSERTRQEALALWLEGALPRVTDSESSVQEACLDHFDALILTHLNNDRLRRDQAVRALLDSFLTALCNGDSAAGRYTALAIKMISFKSGIVPGIFASLQDMVLEEEENDSTPIVQGAWSLLANIVESDSNRKSTHVLHITKLTELALSGVGGRHSCRIASALAANIPKKDKERLASKFVNYLIGVCNGSQQLNDEFNADVIPGMVSTLSSLDATCGDTLLQHCDEAFARNGLEWREVHVVSAVLMAGEVCVSFPLRNEPPSRLVNYMQALMDRNQPERIRAVALASVGKLCFCDSAGVNESTGRSRRVGFGEMLARRSITLFVRELNDGCSIAARVNSLIVLSDLCRRYTAVVEPHIGRLAMCLRDMSETVRQRAIASLASLFQEDYLKVRGGPIFFRLVLSLLDPVIDMRRSAEYVLSHLLLPKSPLLLSTNFVETIFVLNCCQAHPVFNKFLRCREEEVADEAIAGTSEQRLVAYRWLLSRMPLEQRVGLSSRLRQDILLPVSEQKLDTCDLRVDRVLSDALLLLADSAVCLQGSADTEGEESELGVEASTIDASEESRVENSKSNMPANMRAKLLARVFLMELKEEIIPVLLELKRHMETIRSPLLANVRTCMCQILKPYQKDLDSLIEDATLRAEIVFDLRDGEHEKKRKDRAKKSASAAAETLEDITNCPASNTMQRTRNRNGRKETVRKGTMRDVEIANSNPRTRLATTIEASPKLASIAKTRQSRAIRVDVTTAEQQDSGGLARILEL